jgi:hypothetical protein
MDSTMPFSKLHLDPDHIETMRAAFNQVCDVLQLNCGHEDPLTELIVLKLVELAKAGERGPESLCFDVLAELGTPLQHATPRSSPDAWTSVVLAEAD